jgi:hypothetical protein
MSDPGLSALIREVLAEELAKACMTGAVSTPQPACEQVRIANSADLNSFAERVLALASDPQVAKDIESGKKVFELAGDCSPGTVRESPFPGGEGIHTIEKGFVSERQIDRLPKDAKRLMLGKAARITPLARDRARQRGIAIERMET